MSEPKVEVAPDAVEYIRGRGGELYIWADAAGLVHSHLGVPPHPEAWSCIQDRGIHVNLAPSALGVSTWRVVLRRVPWKRLDVTSDLTIGTSPTAPGVA